MYMIITIFVLSRQCFVEQLSLLDCMHRRAARGSCRRRFAPGIRRIHLVT